MGLLLINGLLRAARRGGLVPPQMVRWVKAHRAAVVALLAAALVAVLAYRSHARWQREGAKAKPLKPAKFPGGALSKPGKPAKPAKPGKPAKPSAGGGGDKMSVFWANEADDGDGSGNMGACGKKLVAGTSIAVPQRMFGAYKGKTARIVLKDSGKVLCNACRVDDCCKDSHGNNGSCQTVDFYVGDSKAGLGKFGLKETVYPITVTWSGGGGCSGTC